RSLPTEMRLLNFLLQADRDAASSRERPNLRNISGAAPSSAGRINPVMLAGCLATVAGVCALIYAVLPSNEYAAVQRENRRGYDAERNQPGEMRVWSSPFGHRGDKTR
ncbi:hypothetical protein BOX15_Mlig016588g4, partial [Macrostomum lignano]